MKNLVPPYYAVIFTSKKSTNLVNYDQTADQMEHLAAQQPGYLDFVASTCDDGRTVATSYWQTEADILNWKKQQEHVAARQMGKQSWYDEFTVEVAKVERAYSWTRETG
ncbi:MAG: heme-degrading monooxygenase HmoA [Saprospiraceae bacterium]|jgi:heme-degrading monooxygenase HmoA